MEESQRQAARDDAFLKITGALVQQPCLVVTSIASMSETRTQFRYGITKFRPNSGIVSHLLSGSR